MNPQAAQFDSQFVLQQLEGLPRAQKYWVGYSGGADSTALLHALANIKDQLPAPLHAIHFHHGLQPTADDWQRHCELTCQEWSVPLTVQQLQLNLPVGKSPEAEARRLRYQAVEQLLGTGEIYLTAHHANDLAETLFLNLMRGSGLDGLASIPVRRQLGAGWLARPLLRCRRDQLEQYLRDRQINWVEDPSNQNQDYDRNYLRQFLFPVIEERWPELLGSLGRTANHSVETRDVLDQLLADIIRRIRIDFHSLSLQALLEQDRKIQALILRQWIHEHGVNYPPRARLLSFLSQLNERVDKPNTAELKWSGWQIKRYLDVLWMHRQGQPADCPTRFWEGTALLLGGDQGSIDWPGFTHATQDQWSTGPKTAGSTMSLREDGPGRKMKDLFRLHNIPPWLRTAIPVLYCNRQAMAVGDWLFHPAFRRLLAEHGGSYTWRPAHPVLQKIRHDSHRQNIDPHDTLG